MTAPRPRSLRLHLLNIVLLAVLPVLLLGGWTALDLAARLRAAQEARLAAEASAARDAVAHEVESLVLMLETFAASPLLDPATRDLPRFHAWAGVAKRLADTWVVFYDAADPSRQALNTSLPWGTPLPAPHAGAPALRALASGRVETSGVLALPDRGVEVMAVGVPVRRGREVIGALGAVLDPQRLARLLQPGGAGRADGDAAWLISADFRLMARNPHRPDLAGLDAPPWLRAAIAERASGILRGPGFDGQDSVIAFARMEGTGWVVAVRETAGAFDAASREPALRLFVVALALLAAGAIGVAWQSRRLVRPLMRLAGRDVRPGGARVTEFEELTAAVRGIEEALRREAANSARAAQDAEDDRRLLSSVMQSVPDPIFVKDLSLRYVLINEAGAAVAGRPIEEIIGRTDAELFDASAAAVIARSDRAVMQAELFREQEEHLTDAAGRPRWFLSVKGPWRDARGNVAGLIGVARDVTERKETERRLAAAEAAMRRIARADSMAAMSVGLAHELNQPLTAANNFLRAALRFTEGNPPDPARLAMAREAMAEAAAQTVRAGEIIQRLRDFIGRGEPERRRVELGVLALESVTLARAARGPTAPPVPVVMDGRSHVVLGDPVQLQQVMVNLLRNALEAAEDSEPPRLMLRLTRRPGEVALEVEDNGPGIPPEVMERLFEPFQSSKEAGLGIGLSICRALIEAHHGKLEALPNPEGGTVMRVTLPEAA